MMISTPNLVVVVADVVDDAEVVVAVVVDDFVVGEFICHGHRDLTSSRDLSLVGE